MRGIFPGLAGTLVIVLGVLYAVCDYLGIGTAPAVVVAISGGIAIYLLEVLRTKISGPNKEQPKPKSFTLAEKIRYADVDWIPILLSYSEKMRNTIRVTDPLCPKCGAPLYYNCATDADPAESPTSAECPTCEEKNRYPFPRGIHVTKELARRHAIGMSSRKEIFQPWWVRGWRFITKKRHFKPLLRRG